MAYYLQYVDLTTDTLNVVDVCNFTFFEDLDCDLLIRKNMDSFFDFAKCSLAKRFRDSVAAYHNLLDPFYFRNNRFVWQVDFLGYISMRFLLVCLRIQWDV